MKEDTWIPVQFSGLTESYLISKDKQQTGLDVILADGAPTKQKSNGRVILHTKRGKVPYSVELIRKIHVEVPSWAPYIDFGIECMYDPLETYLLSLRDDHGNETWKTVEFRGLASKYMVSRYHTGRGDDIISLSPRGSLFRKISKFNSSCFFWTKSKKVGLSVETLRLWHFYYHDWCKMVDLSTCNHLQSLILYLLDLRDTNGHEIWKFVSGYPDYLINRYGDSIIQTSKLAIRSTKPNFYGYCHVFMKNSEGTRNMYVHRLVWETFRSSIPNGMTVDHIDRNKTNNNVDNLRLATKTEQQRNKSTTKSGCILQLEFRSTENSVWQSVECPTNFHFAGISEKQMLDSICDSKEIGGFMFRYKIADMRYDSNGKEEFWHELKGTKYFVSSEPSDTISKKGARIMQIIGERKYMLRIGNGSYERIHSFGILSSLHRLIYQTFYGDIPKGYHIDHIDGDSTNNFYTNLRAMIPCEHVTKTHGIAVSVDGKSYNSIASASSATGIGKSSISKFLKHGMHTDRFKLLSEPETKRRRIK